MKNKNVIRPSVKVILTIMVLLSVALIGAKRGWFIRSGGTIVSAAYTETGASYKHEPIPVEARRKNVNVGEITNDVTESTLNSLGFSLSNTVSVRVK